MRVRAVKPAIEASSVSLPTLGLVARARHPHAAAGPRHLTSGRRFARLHHDPPCSGHRARKGGTNLDRGMSQP
jgi:hypothetical protein